MKQLIMKKMLLFAAVFTLTATTIQAQQLRIDNQTNCPVWIDFHCRDASCTPGTEVSTGNYASPPIFGPGMTMVDANILYLAVYSTSIPLGFAWEYGLVGSNITCPPAGAGGGCNGYHIQMTTGNCTGGTALTSGCVNVDACNGGCTVFNVTAVFDPVTGDCDLTIN